MTTDNQLKNTLKNCCLSIDEERKQLSINVTRSQFIPGKISESFLNQFEKYINKLGKSTLNKSKERKQG